MAATCRHGHGLLGSLRSRDKGGSKPQTSPYCLGTVRTPGWQSAQNSPHHLPSPGSRGMKEGGPRYLPEFLLQQEPITST